MTKTSSTDTPKRLSDDEVAAQFLALEDFLSNVDGHDMTDWSTDESGEVRGMDEGTIDAEDAYKAMDALRAHIAALTAPPSQGKVERAREMYRANYEEVCSKDTRQWPSREHLFQLCEDAAIAAITQALTESSGQGTDGAEEQS